MGKANTIFGVRCLLDSVDIAFLARFLNDFGL